MPHTAFLCLGTNMGNKLRNLQNAIAAMPPDLSVQKWSSVFETVPWGYSDQPEFFNQVVKVTTELDPHQLLFHVKWIETKLDRQPTFRYGPRSIDIDILFFDDLVLNTPKLVIPHPRLPERAFALVPMAELDPDFIHPQLHVTIAQMLKNVDASGVKMYIPASGFQA